MVKNPWTTMRSNHNTSKDCCHEDISQDKNEKYHTHRKLLQHKKITILASPFASFSLKKYPAPIEYVACLFSRFQYCYQIRNLNITTEQHNFIKVRQLKIQAEVSTPELR
jgi:hypothetical protein